MLAYISSLNSIKKRKKKNFYSVPLEKKNVEFQTSCPYFQSKLKKLKNLKSVYLR